MPRPSADLDLRLVRYFTVLAEHRRFVSAAEELRITQPSLSRQISKLETQVGARLLERTARGSRLTEAGEAFLPHARALLRSAAHATAAARTAAQPQRITIGYTADLFITAAVRHMRHHHPDADIHTSYLSWDSPREALLDHRVDAVVTRLPLTTDGLTVTTLYDEPRVLAVPLGHSLAGRASVTLDDIADEPLPRVPDPAWNAYWRIDPRPDGRPAPGGPLARVAEDKLEFVASGQAVAIMPVTARLRPDITTIPLRGVDPGHVVLATRAADPSRLLAAFRSSARTHLTGRPAPGPSSPPTRDGRRGAARG
ncbi:LysR substrate-binding domain-containing protein [Streptomyces fuscichromogenes]|uniref:LysR substrate-binding domain-containing protein n=1 Tax=Streptomyces fuscichromogenes TaxID=1324013 RepID=UPI00382980DD